MRRLVQAIAATAALSATAGAQPAPTSATPEIAGNRWSVAAGYESFALRDISRNGRPPDASPISWRGAGPSVSGRYDIDRERSSHLIEATVSRAGDFTYEGPSRSTAAARSDLATRFAASYEYRRYPWRDVLFDGFDVGVGVQGLATHVGFERHITQTLETRTRIAGGGFAAVVAVRVDRFDRLQVDATWTNGAVLSHRNAWHSSQEEDESYGGGNWLTNAMVRVNWRVAGTMHLTAAWRRDYDGYSSDHFSYAGHRHGVEFGVLYAR